MSVLEILLFAILQGVTELFPISSLGHGVIIPDVLHWQLDRSNEAFLPLMVVLHLGTAAALLIYFRRDWQALLGGFLQARGKPDNPASRLLWLLVIGTLPAGILGLLLEKKLRLIFSSTSLVLGFLLLNGLLLLVGDYLKRRQRGHALEGLTPASALKIGFAQSLALLPGISRSGATLTAGLAMGLDYAASARFSFLLATPIILAAGLLEVPKLLRMAGQVPTGLIGMAGVLSGLCAYASTWFLMRYFNQHEAAALRPYAWYCILAGCAGLAWKALA